jgi:hypothetical protein
MKKHYEPPLAKVTKIEVSDIILASVTRLEKASLGTLKIEALDVYR